MSRAHDLHRLALAAIWSAPQSPLVARANRVHGVPELGSDSRVRRVFEHAAQLAAFDFPSNFAAELEVITLVVNRPGPVRLHKDSAVGRSDELVKGQRFFSGKNAYIGHADEGNSIPAFGTHGAVGAGLADGVRRLPRRDISSEKALGDNGSALRLNAFVVISERTQAGTVLLCRIGNYVYQIASVAKLAQLFQRKERCAGKICFIAQHAVQLNRMTN